MCCQHYLGIHMNHIILIQLYWHFLYHLKDYALSVIVYLLIETASLIITPTLSVFKAQTLETLLHCKPTILDRMM